MYRYRSSYWEHHLSCTERGRHAILMASVPGHRDALKTAPPGGSLMKRFPMVLDGNYLWLNDQAWWKHFLFEKIKNFPFKALFMFLKIEKVQKMWLENERNCRNYRFSILDQNKYTGTWILNSRKYWG